MHLELVSHFICPHCGCLEFSVKAYERTQDDIHEGLLTCLSCRTWYRIEGGIVDLLPLSLRDQGVYNKFAARHNILLSTKESLKDGDPRAFQIDFFKEYISTYDKKVSDSSFYKALNAVIFLPWIHKYLRRGDKVVDLGCGTGKQILILAQKGIASVGIDISQDMLLQASKKIDAAGVHQFIDLVLADAQNPPLKNGSFKACVLCGTLHHLPDPQVALSNAADKLADGGVLFTFDPHKSPARFMFDWMMKIWKLYKEDDNENQLISQGQLAQWLANAGLKGTIRLSTYLPPHLMYALSAQTNTVLLKVSDSVFSRIPRIKNLGGVIIAQAVKVNLRKDKK